LCRRAGVNVHPNMERKYLIGVLDGDIEAPPMTEQSHPIDRWRHAIIGFLLDYWVRVHPQLKCPARNLNHPEETRRDRRPCFKCTDLQVMTCVQQNAHNETRMRKYLPVLRTEEHGSSFHQHSSP